MYLPLHRTPRAPIKTPFGREKEKQTQIEQLSEGRSTTTAADSVISLPLRLNSMTFPENIPVRRLFLKNNPSQSISFQFLSMRKRHGVHRRQVA